MRRILKNIKKMQPVVVKVGTRLLTNNKGILDRKAFKNIVSEISKVREMGYPVILVSSGAVTAGKHILAKHTNKWGMPQVQAAASIGQPILMYRYREEFKKKKIETSQILLTHDDIVNRNRYINVKSTLTTLLDADILPIINENDSVSIDEIKIGDNDTLSAKVAHASGASLLIILTDVDGVKRKNKRIPAITNVTPEIESLAGGRGSVYAIGGMKTKIIAAKQLMKSGIAVIIANGNKKNILCNLLKGRDDGTFFLPSAGKIPDRKTWIYFCQVLKGGLIIDKGAVAAVTRNGKSLLPSGVVGVLGDFAAKDSVQFLTETGEEIARGISNFSSEEIKRIMGKHSSEIPEILDNAKSHVIVHRNNMVLKPE